MPKGRMQSLLSAFEAELSKQPPGKRYTNAELFAQTVIRKAIQGNRHFAAILARHMLPTVNVNLGSERVVIVRDFTKPLPESQQPIVEIQTLPASPLVAELAPQAADPAPDFACAREKSELRDLQDAVLAAERPDAEAFLSQLREFQAERAEAERERAEHSNGSWSESAKREASLKKRLKKSSEI
jgi:hypothetical protein